MSHGRNKRLCSIELKKFSNTPELDANALCLRVVNGKWENGMPYRAVAWMKCNVIRENTTPDCASSIQATLDCNSVYVG